MFDPRVDSIISELKRLNQHFCKKVKCCLGISNTGDPNLVLNQQGEWVTAGSGGDIQTLLSDLPEYLGAKEASEDGRPLNYWYYNTFFNTVSKVTQYIDTFSSGTSTIDFTNNGGDDWDISFLATPTTVQSSANIVQYMYNVEYWVGGVQTNIESGNKTTDYTLNTSGNGACVYRVEQTFVFDDSSFFIVNSLFKVDASGTVIAFTSANGITVNSTNGLDINATANYTEFGVNYPLQWGSYDAFPPAIFNPIGNTTTINATLPIATVGVGFFPILDSIFTDDFPNWAGSAITLTIS
jgi:hypothetical protein